MAKNELATKSQLLPVLERERKQCPFYGFSAFHGGIFLDTKGNQCALITGSHSPCRMELREETPNWRDCPYNTPEKRATIEAHADAARVFPDEFRPQGAKSWEGVTFGQWQEYVMNRPPSS